MNINKKIQLKFDCCFVLLVDWLAHTLTSLSQKKKEIDNQKPKETRMGSVNSLDLSKLVSNSNVRGRNLT